jgi:hypothetical protein
LATSEQIQQVARAVHDTHDFDAALDDSIRDEMVADRELA